MRYPVALTAVSRGCSSGGHVGAHDHVMPPIAMWISEVCVHDGGHVDLSGP